MSIRIPFTGARLSGWLIVAGAAIVICGGIAVGVAMTVDSSALWRIVHDRCLPHLLRDGNPAPCAAVEINGGVANGDAVLKDLVGTSQFLLIPTRRIGGVESPATWAPDAPNFFARAWDARRFVFERLGKDLPRDAIGLAINAADRRSQDQLHIHIDCLRADVRTSLAEAVASASHASVVTLVGNPYDLITIADPNLAAVNPFRLAAERLADPDRDMARETLVIAGTTSGYLLLIGRSDPAHKRSGHGEDLLDHACSIAR